MTLHVDSGQFTNSQKSVEPRESSHTDLLLPSKSSLFYQFSCHFELAFGPDRDAYQPRFTANLEKTRFL